MRRLELAGITVCSRCGRGRADLRSDQDDVLSVPLDPIRTRELAGTATDEELKTLTDVVLGQLAAAGLVAREVVLDLIDGRLRGLLSIGADQPDVISCTADEGVALAVRGQLKLYASAEALAHTSALRGRRNRQGPETVH